MTALTNFVISTILGFIGFQTPVESELTKQVDITKQDVELSQSPKFYKNCENLLISTCI